MVCDDYGVLMELSKSRKELLRFHGFCTKYDTFKLWDIGTHNQMLCLDSVTNEQIIHSVRKKDVWSSQHIPEMYEELLGCIKKVFPNHPAFRKDGYVERF